MLIKTVLLFAITPFAYLSAGTQNMDLSKFDGTGVIEKEVSNQKPDSRGIIESDLLILPEFERGIYYAPVRSGNTAIGNRFFGVSFTSIDDLRIRRKKLNAQQPEQGWDMGSFICLKISDQRYMALLAMAGEDAFSSFTLREDGMCIDSGTLGKDVFSGLLPKLAYASGDTPHEAALYAWKAALNSRSVNHSTNLRCEKQFPEPFKYPGYCTWEHLRRNLNEKILSGIMNDMNASQIPFRWMLIDDGYESVDPKTSGLSSLLPSKSKFPNGFAPLKALKNENGVRWIGLWWHMAGYFGGISPNHKIAEYENILSPLSPNYLAPKSDQESANIFYEARAREMAGEGIDFIKVDFQTQFFRKYKGQPNPVQSASYNHRALERAWGKHLKGLMNCIAQYHLHVFKHKNSASIRYSIDFAKGKPENHAYVTLQSLRNSLYLGAIHWGDYDMFLSSLPTGKMMAEIRAVAGSPLYVSEYMNKVDADVILPAIWSDGEILRPLAPATLTPEGFFADPETMVVRAFAPLEGNAIAFWLANLHNKETTEVVLSPDDYRFGPAMMQPYEGLWQQPSEGLVAFDWHKGKAWKMTGELKLQLPRWETRIVHMVPIRNGWAVIGRPDKYLSPAACRVLNNSPDEIVVRLKESGPFLIWMANGTPAVAGAEVSQVDKNLYRIELTVSGESQTCTIKKKNASL